MSEMSTRVKENVQWKMASATTLTSMSVEFHNLSHGSKGADMVMQELQAFIDAVLSRDKKDETKLKTDIMQKVHMSRLTAVLTILGRAAVCVNPIKNPTRWH